MRNPQKWFNGWQSEEYVERKQKHFEVIDNYLNKPISNILDIGCGIAHESIQFNKKYNTQLTLLESNKKNKGREAGYNSSADQFDFYHTLDELDTYFKNINLTNYKLVDAKTYDSDEKFDLICSYLSCGFHYPITEYKTLIQKHMHDNTVLIFTLRRKANHECDIKNIIFESQKYITAEIEL